MPLEITIDDKALRAALARFPNRMSQNLTRAFGKFGAQAVRTVTSDKLSAPDDRIPIPALGGLGVRPVGSRGLVRRTGSLARALVFKTDRGTEQKVNPSLRIGFISPRQAMIARVHELGTVGKGGALADISGRPFLKVPLRGLGSAAGAAKDFILLRKVSIPPRLGFFAAIQGMVRSNVLKRFLSEAIKATINPQSRAG